MMYFIDVQDERVVLPPALDATSGSTGASASASAAPHGIEIAIEFKPVERPTEPVDNDQPVQCPFPEPSILNVSSGASFIYYRICLLGVC